MLRYRYKTRPRRFSATYGPGGGPEARIKRMRVLVTALIRNERIEATWQKCDESRGYAERLIDIAIKNGDRDAKTMEMADYWLLEKDLIHKLFKVLVPRYKNFNTTYTAIHRLPNKYGGIEPHLHSGDGQPMGILELKGNIWPPVKPKPRVTKHLLSNVLLDAFREDYMREQRKQQRKAKQKVEQSVFGTTTNSDTDVQETSDSPERLFESADSDTDVQKTSQSSESLFEGKKAEDIHKDNDIEQMTRDTENMDLSSQNRSDKTTKGNS